MKSTGFSCAQSGCFQKALPGSSYCKAHEHDNDRRRQKPERKLYNLSAWRRAHGFRAALLVQNPICQRIIHGQQCTQPASVVHHLLDPKIDETKFFNPKNVVCLCAGHHPGGTLGTPDWKPGIDFAPTKWETPRVG